MNKSIKNKFALIAGMFFLIFLLLSFQPILSYAQGVDEDGGKKADTIITLVNPLGDKVNDLPSFIYMILEIVFEIGAVVSVLAIIYVGFMFVRARGNSEELVTARRALLYTAIGIAVLLGAVLIATVIDSTITDLSTGI